jgi:hypothetical protein
MNVEHEMSIRSTGLSRKERKIGAVSSGSIPFSPSQVELVSPTEVKPLVCPSELEPLVVKPKVAWRLLGCSNNYGYGLLAAGELESFKDGNSRKITMASIKARIARQLESAKAAPDVQPIRTPTTSQSQYLTSRTSRNRTSARHRQT